jgi:Na+/H+-dicarboxylate symporter
VKTTIAIAAGALVCYVISREAGNFFRSIIHTTYWEYDIPLWIQLALVMIPGIIVGAITPNHCMRNTVFAMFIGCVFILLDISLHNPDYQIFNLHFAMFTLIACFCGAVSSCYGARLSDHFPKLFSRFVHFFTAE